MVAHGDGSSQVDGAGLGGEGEPRTQEAELLRHPNWMRGRGEGHQSHDFEHV